MAAYILTTINIFVVNTNQRCVLYIGVLYWNYQITSDWILMRCCGEIMMYDMEMLVTPFYYDMRVNEMVRFHHICAT